MKQEQNPKFKIQMHCGASYPLLGHGIAKGVVQHGRRLRRRYVLLNKGRRVPSHPLQEHWHAVLKGGLCKAPAGFLVHAGNGEGMHELMQEGQHVACTVARPGGWRM